MFQKTVNLYKRIHDIGIIPFAAVDNVENAAPLAKALCVGGLPIAEIAYISDASHDALTEMKKTCPEMLTGAGNISTVEQVDSALDAGAEFIFASGLDPDMIRYCQGKNISVIPEVSNASDIEKAISLGLDTLKFSPAEKLGGIDMIKTLSASYRKIKFIPDRGINERNINEYLNEPCILACSGTWMIDKKAIDDKNFGKIAELTGCAVNNIMGITIKHIGINEENGEGAELAKLFARIFCGRVRETSKGWFGSEFAEIMSVKAGIGKHGHIGIGVNNPDRARRYYESLGYSFDERTAAYDENGDLTIVYFSGEFGGFALHIVKK